VSSIHARSRTRWTAAALGLAPAMIVVVGLLVVPLITLLRYSFNQYSTKEFMVEAFTLENYVRFFVEPYYQDVMLTTFGLSLLCTVTSLLAGFPVAYFLARTRSRFKTLVFIAVLFPLLVGNVIRAAGWMSFLGREGFLNVVLAKVGLISAPLELMYTPYAVFIGLLGVLLPFMILTLQGVLEGIDFTLVDAANNLGAKPSRAFRHVILPLCIPGITAGSILVFTVAMNSYATPLLLGGPEFRMMAPTLYAQIAIASNWPFGAALAFILIIITFVVTILSTWMLARQYKAT
jgi:putative spermidine/putrescine transport system permease protein